jgi:hypothetical protein
MAERRSGGLPDDYHVELELLRMASDGLARGRACPADSKPRTLLRGDGSVQTPAKKLIYPTSYLKCRQAESFNYRQLQGR